MNKMSEKFRIESHVLGMVGTNCYFLINEETKQVILIDPADNADYITDKICEKELQLCGILLTHGHFDHIMAVNDLSKEFSVKIYAMEEEREMLGNPDINLSSRFGKPLSVTADVNLKNGDTFFLADFLIKAIHTPGHTNGSGCFYLKDEDVLLSGDTLFFESIGRTDLPMGSTREITHSIKYKLLELNDQVKVYPGHGDVTTIEHERQYNPFIV